MDTQTRIDSAPAYIILIAAPAPSLASICALIASAGHTLRLTGDCDSALAQYAAEKPDLVLLHRDTPGDVFASCAQICDAADPPPVLMLFDTYDSDSAEAAFAAGAVDIVVLPAHPALLERRMTYLLERYDLLRRAAETEEARRRLQASEERYHQQEEVLRQHAEALEQRNRELDAFAHTVAHDLKNPLANIMGFASVVEMYYDRMDKNEIKDHMQAIMEGIYRMRSIINSLLVLAGVNKIERVTLYPLEMTEIVEEMQRNIQYLIYENNAEIILPESWPVATGYPGWVEEVWANYVSNAIKYGGRPPHVELGADPPENGMVRFWVRDNGSGLTSEEQAQLFTPFTRLSQINIEGHGLGLSVVQRIIERLGGQVGVESEPGKGSRFWFTLPNGIVSVTSSKPARKSSTHSPNKPAAGGVGEAASVGGG